MPAGDYVYEVRDAEGCIASAPYTIEEGIEIVITENTVDSNNPSCFGFSDGQVCVELAGGVAPYTALLTKLISLMSLQNYVLLIYLQGIT